MRDKIDEFFDEDMPGVDGDPYDYDRDGWDDHNWWDDKEFE